MEGFVRYMKYVGNKRKTADCNEKGQQKNCEGKKEERVLKQHDKRSTGLVSNKNDLIEGSACCGATLSLFR
jgi:hypothetical protein